jgi:hypothetical protein
LATALAGYVLYCIVGPFKTSYNRDLDVIKSWYLIIAAAIFALLFHSNLNRSVWADFGWAFSQYLETIAILSQFILFNKKVKKTSFLGRINRDIHVTFHRSPSDLKNFFVNFLDFHLHITERIQSRKIIKSASRIRWLLVHDRPSNPSFHHGRFHVLLGKGSPKRIRRSTSHLHLISIALYMFLPLAVCILESTKVLIWQYDWPICF